MKKNIDIICIIDKSGSMSPIKNDAIGGFNSFLEDQKKAEYQAFMTIVLFDTRFKKISDEIAVQKIEPLNGTTYSPGGNTALYDAIGQEIDNYLDYLASLPKEERSEKALFVILTDGEENSSKIYHKELIKNMIEDVRENIGIEFIYLGANQDSFLAATNIGISGNNSFNYAATGDGIKLAYSKISEATAYYSTTEAKEDLFQQEKK